MFGAKRQKQILQYLQRLEAKQAELYHLMRSDMADVEEQVGQLNAFMLRLNLDDILETMEHFNLTTTYIADLIENCSVECDNPFEENHDNCNGSH